MAAKKEDESNFDLCYYLHLTKYEIFNVTYQHPLVSSFNEFNLMLNRFTFHMIAMLETRLKDNQMLIDSLTFWDVEFYITIAIKLEVVELAVTLSQILSIKHIW